MYEFKFESLTEYRNDEALRFLVHVDIDQLKYQIEYIEDYDTGKVYEYWHLSKEDRAYIKSTIEDQIREQIEFECEVREKSYAEYEASYTRWVNGGSR